MKPSIFRLSIGKQYLFARVTHIQIQVSLVSSQRTLAVCGLRKKNTSLFDADDELAVQPRQ
jgi:hypothetical protein